jgi:hypothetical protein
VQLCYFCPNCNLIRESWKCSRYSNWATGWTIQGSNLCRERYFSPEREKRLWVPPSLLFNWYWGSFPGVKRPKREVGYSPISIVNVQNEWNYTSIPCMPTWREEGRLRLYIVRSDRHVPTVVEQGQWTPCMKPHLRARADIKRNFLRSNDHQVSQYTKKFVNKNDTLILCRVRSYTLWGN